MLELALLFFKMQIVRNNWMAQELRSKLTMGELKHELQHKLCKILQQAIEAI
jgi:hypothetical protein